MNTNHSTHFVCAKQIREVLVMQPGGLSRGDLYARIQYPGKTDANFGVVLNTLVQDREILDVREPGKNVVYMTPKAAPVIKVTPPAAPVSEPVAIRIILAEERRRLLIERMRELGHPVCASDVFGFGFHVNKPLIYPDLKLLVECEVLERRSLPSTERLMQAHWWFRGETWPELQPPPRAEPETPAAEAKAHRPDAAANVVLSDAVDTAGLPELLTSLTEARDAAQETLNAYINSVCDKRVIASLKQNITFAEKALAVHLLHRKGKTA